MGDLVEDPELGLVSPHWRRLGGLVVPLGTVDRPREQRRDTLTINLAGAGGHVAVVGGPRSGKSTLLRTIVTSMSLTSTPQESQIFVLDFGGGTFAPLARLPHVSGVGTRSEPDVVRRVVAEVSGVVDRREAYFRAQGIDSIETYRSRRAAGRADDGYGDVFLVVDGWNTLRSDFDDLETEIQQLAARGPHLRPARRHRQRPVGGLPGRDARRLRHPARAAARRPRRLRGGPQGRRPGAERAAGTRPGARASCTSSARCPRIDGDPDSSTVGDGVDDLVKRSDAAWHGPRGPKLRLLPERITLEQIRTQAETLALPDRLLLLGVDEKELAPVGLDMDLEPHLLVYGDSQSGKSALLRGLIREITRTRTAKQAQLVVVDYRRSLLGEVPEEYQLHYLTSAAQATPALRDLATYLESRIPGPDVTPDQLRNRSWWTGAEAFVLVDDYDLVATQQSSPLAVLQPMMAQARDVGLHIVVARRSGGASRASYESVLQSMRDLAMPGLLLSGSPEEGPLLGKLRPQLAPPDAAGCSPAPAASTRSRRPGPSRPCRSAGRRAGSVR